MTHILKQAAYKHGYLVITAAWLYTFSFIFINYWNYHSTPQKVQSKIESRLKAMEQRFETIVEDTALVASLADSAKQKTTLVADDIGLFIYHASSGNASPSLIYWNTNRMYVNTEELFFKDSTYFIENQNGSFEMIKRTVHLPNTALLVVAMLPVRWSYFIENKYLHTDFEGFANLNEQYEISKNYSSTNILFRK